MKKTLFTLIACATVVAASAEVTTFVPQAAPLCRYDGKPDQMIVMPVGFNYRFPSDTKQRVPNWDKEARFIEKSMVSDRIEMWEHHIVDANNTGLTQISCGHVADGSYRWFFDRAIQITPAQGLTVTGIRIKLERTEGIPAAVVEANGAELSVVNNFSYSAADSMLTLTCNYNKPFYILNMGKNSERKAGTLRPFYFEFTTTGTSTQVAIPQYNIQQPMIAKNEKIELTCPTPDAKIYYTIDYKGIWDGSRVGGVRANEPTTESTLYTGPFSIEKDAIVRAIAVKDGMASSFVTYKEYYVMPEYQEMATFDFTDFTSIKDENGQQIAKFETYPVVNPAVSTSTTEKVSIVTTPAVDKDATITGTITSETDGTGCDITLSNSFGGVVELRPLKGSKLYISVPDDKYLSAVYMEASTANAITLGDGMPGTYKDGFVTTSRKIWTYEGKDVYELELNVIDSSQYVDRFFVFYSDVNPSGVTDVNVEANAPAVYYNLQGMRVNSPVKGNIYIKSQGAKATKVVY